MFFSQPWMLIGLGLCALPVLIHLLSRRVYRREPWAAMRFLRAALDRRARQLRLESLLLLVVRTLLVLLLVAALAEPIFYAAGTAATRSPTRRILIVDLSASMGTRSDGERRYDRMLREVEATLNDAAPGDAFQLVRISTLAPHTLIRRETYETFDVRSELSRWGLTEERGDVVSALQSAVELLRSPDADASKEVVIVSDFQRSNWWPEEAAIRGRIQQLLTQLGTRSRLRCVDVSGSPSGNLALVSLESSRRVTAPDQDIELTAVVRNYGTAQTSARVEWLVGGKLIDSSLEEIAGLGESIVRLPIRTSSGDATDVEVRLATDDALAADNQRFLSIPIRPLLRVLVVDGRPGVRPVDGAAGFLALALAPPLSASAGSRRQIPMQVEVIGTLDLADVSLADYDCVWLCDVPGLPAAQKRRLAAYIVAGGGLVMTPGEQTVVAEWSDWVDIAGSQILPATLQSSVDADGAALAFRLEPVPHPLTEPFVGNPGAGLETTRIRRYCRATPSENPAVRRVLSFDNDQPAVLAQAVGQGQVVLVLTSVDDRWGNWAIWPSFLPLVHGMTIHAAYGGRRLDHLTVGSAIERTWPPSKSSVDVAVLSPDGERASLIPECDAVACQLRFGATIAVGIYSLEAGPPLNQWETIAVNLDTAESTSSTVDESEMSREILPKVRFSYGSGGQGNLLTSSTPVARGSLAGPLLIAVLVLLVAEKLLAWRSRWGLASLVLSGAGAALWQLWRVNPQLAMALMLTIAAAGAVVRHGLVVSGRNDS